MNIKTNFLRLSLLSLVCSLTWACSDTQLPGEEEPTPMAEALFNAPSVVMPEDVVMPAMSTRATYFDGEKLGVSFSWEKGYFAGITPMLDSAPQMKYECKNVSATAEEATDGISRANFRQEDANFAWVAAQKYRAYFPYTTAADITAIPLDYSGQQQNGKPDMEDYYKAGSDKTNYYATEKSASKHLTEKSYMISNVTTAEANKDLSFKMSYLCGIVRFFLTMPIAEIKVTEIRLVATKAVFQEKVTLNMLDGKTTPQTQPTNNIVLTLKDAVLKGNESVEGSNRLVAYMMAHPVELTNDEILGNNGKLYIYVKGESNGKDVYYRSGAIKKKDIAAGVLTQFSVSPTEKDEPIDVQPITVQEWQAGLTLNNNGKGTESW